MRRHVPLPLACLTLLVAAWPLGALDGALPNGDDSLKFAVIGDSGTGDSAQRDVAMQMYEAYQAYRYELVLMLGDNLYGRERPRDYASKFERPYQPLLDAGVRFYATLGNHDEREQRFYKHFNMDGELYYSFKAPRQDVRFFALESSYMDPTQLEWLERELSRARESWKIVFMHHPIYSSGGRHGSDVALRQVLEPLFFEHGVSLVLAGHEHFYERLEPQNGIVYITQGAAAKLRRGNIRRSSGLTAAGFDSDRSFTVMEIEDDLLYLQTISRRGRTVDTSVIRRRMQDAPATRPAPFVFRHPSSPGSRRFEETLPHAAAPG